MACCLKITSNFQLVLANTSSKKEILYYKTRFCQFVRTCALTPRKQLGVETSNLAQLIISRGEVSQGGLSCHNDVTTKVIFLILFS